MTHKRKLGLLLLSSIIVLGVSYLLVYSRKLGFCDTSSCVIYYGSKIGQPVFIAGFLASMPLFALFFLRQEVYRAWMKFARIALPLAVVWVAVVPNKCGSGFAGFGGCTFDKEFTSIFVTVVFFAITLAIFIKKSLALRKTVITTDKEV